MGCSPGRVLNGTPHSKRRGPMGENQRNPNPQLWRYADQLSGPRQGSLLGSTTDGLILQYWSSRLKALPMSVNTTPRMPTLSKIGNSISAFMMTFMLPPTRKLRSDESGDRSESARMTGPSDRGGKPR